jgi:ubiquitin C-terminal hydrolase
MNHLYNNFKGFNNIGNTCYLNSGLQLVINNKDLCNIIIKNSNKNKILNNIAGFINDYYNNNDNISLTPNYIKNIVSLNNKEFIGFSQNDSFEFILYFLDFLFSSTKLDNIYEINTDISIKCKFNSCLTISSHEEKNNFLLLDITNETLTLDDSYRNYKSYDKLVDDNAYYCERCKEKRVASKRTSITNWPKHLIIVLKRFSYNGRSQKNNKEIEVPIIWRHNYILKGIVYHSGSSTGGHYIYIGNHNNKWILFNDESTKELSIEQITNYKNNGYIYYFEKQN